MDKEQISDAVRDYLDEHDIHYEYHAENDNLTMGFSLDCKLKNLRMWWDFLDKGYILYGISPINASPDNLGEVLKYAAMINYGLIPGNIEVDVRDGEIRSKTWVPSGMPRSCQKTPSRAASVSPSPPSNGSVTASRPWPWGSPTRKRNSKRPSNRTPTRRSEPPFHSFCSGCMGRLTPNRRRARGRCRIPPSCG